MSESTIYRQDGGTIYRSAEISYSEGEGDKPGILEGKMVPYDTWTEIKSAVEGHFFERIQAGALTKTLAERGHRMRVLFHHGLDLLGHQAIAKLEELRDEADGAYYRAQLIPGLPGLLLNGLREGLYGTSIGMRMPVKADVNYTPKRSEMNPDGIPESTVLEAGVNEISVTAFPVYEGATAGIRSLTDELIVAKLYQDPEHLLKLVQGQAQVEPPHSEPPAEEETQEEREPEHSPKPTRDYLSEKESEEVWRLP
jgi:HK97 family phage prohead protease